MVRIRTERESRCGEWPEKYRAKKVVIVGFRFLSLPRTFRGFSDSEIRTARSGLQNSAFRA